MKAQQRRAFRQDERRRRRKSVTDAFIDTLPTGADSPWWLSTNCDVVHRSTCRHARHPWLTRRHSSEEEVREWVGKPYVYMRLCRVCLPENKEEKR